MRACGLRRLGTIDLGTLGGNLSAVAAVNASGLVIGTSRPSLTLNSHHAFSWTEAGGMVDILGPMGGLFSSAIAVNDQGQVVGISGFDAFSWTAAGGMITLGTLGGIESVARDVNA